MPLYVYTTFYLSIHLMDPWDCVCLVAIVRNVSVDMGGAEAHSFGSVSGYIYSWILVYLVYLEVELLHLTGPC